VDKIGIIGDPHITSGTISTRVDDAGEVVFRKLVDIFDVFYKEHVNAVIMTGDFCHVPLQSKEYQIRLLELFRRVKSDYGICVYSLVGNHNSDCVNKDWTTYKRKDLGLFASVGFLFVPKAAVFYCDYNGGVHRASFIHAYRFDLEGKYMDAEEAQSDIVVAHYFINSGLGDLVIMMQDLKRLYPNMKYLILGHDHQTYQPVEVEGVTIIAPGSVLRTSYREVDREIYVATIDLATPGVGGVNYIKIPSADGKTVFQQESREMAKASEAQMERFMNSLQGLESKIGEVHKFIQDYISAMNPGSELTQRFIETLRQGGIL
jgi:DNA repair exonuclease SbcCD nuclease subunit